MPMCKTSRVIFVDEPDEIINPLGIKGVGATRPTRAREDDVDAEARAARKGLFESDSVTLPCRYESVNRSTQKPIAGRTGLCHAPSRTRSLAAPPSHWPGPRAGVTFDASHHQRGCCQFSIAISQKDPNHVLLFEAWDNAAAHDAQLTTDRFKQYQATTANMVT